MQLYIVYHIQTLQCMKYMPILTPGRPPQLIGQIFQSHVIVLYRYPFGDPICRSHRRMPVTRQVLTGHPRLRPNARAGGGTDCARPQLGHLRGGGSAESEGMSLPRLSEVFRRRKELGKEAHKERCAFSVPVMLRIVFRYLKTPTERKERKDVGKMV